MLVEQRSRRRPAAPAATRARITSRGGAVASSSAERARARAGSDVLRRDERACASAGGASSLSSSGSCWSSPCGSIRRSSGTVANVVTSATITRIVNRRVGNHVELAPDGEDDQLGQAARVHQDPVAVGVPASAYRRRARPRSPRRACRRPRTASSARATSQRPPARETPDVDVQPRDDEERAGAARSRGSRASGRRCPAVRSARRGIARPIMKAPRIGQIPIHAAANADAATATRMLAIQPMRQCPASSKTTAARFEQASTDRPDEDREEAAGGDDLHRATSRSAGDAHRDREQRPRGDVVDCRRGKGHRADRVMRHPPFEQDPRQHREGRHGHGDTDEEREGELARRAGSRRGAGPGRSVRRDRRPAPIPSTNGTSTLTFEMIAALRRRPAQQRRVQLRADEEHEVREPDVCCPGEQRADVVREEVRSHAGCNPAKEARPEEDPRQDLAHHRRLADAARGASPSNGPRRSRPQREHQTTERVLGGTRVSADAETVDQLLPCRTCIYRSTRRRHVTKDDEPRSPCRQASESAPHPRGHSYSLCRCVQGGIVQ